jgi:hypothetical protein
MTRGKYIARVRGRLLLALLALWLLGAMLPFAFLGASAYAGGNVVWIGEVGSRDERERYIKPRRI